AGLALVVVALCLPGIGWVRAWVACSEWAAILSSGWLVVSAHEGFKGIVGRVLSSSTMMYLGTISYGIYVWHYMIPEIVNLVAYRLHIDARWWSGPGWIQFVALSAASIGTASLSWWAFERPLNDLKRLVRYVSGRSSV